MRNYHFLTILFVACLFLIGSTDDSIPNLTQPKPEIFTAGQPTETGFKELAAMGIRTVINVLPEPQCMKGEQGMVQMNQMVYHKLPFEAATLNRDTIDEFGYLMMTVERPVLIHCSTGNHVGGLWLAHRVLNDRMPVSVAIAEARRIGIRPSMETMVLRWLGESSSAVRTSGR
jgi:uncharacterized protein (TIGR01244 family)